MRRILLLLAIILAVATGCKNETPEAPLLELSESSMEVWFSEAEYTIQVNASHNWSATSDSEWIAIVNSEGNKGVSELKFSVSPNNSAEQRNGAITVQCKGADLSASIAIAQSGVKSEYLEIAYESKDGKVVMPLKADAFGAAIISNTYENGKGLICFDAPVTKVGEEAFCECENLASISLPNSVSEVANWAFYGCIQLKSITLSERTLRIGESAFAVCQKLASITIPESVEEIGDSAFFGCNGMSAIYGKFASEDNRCLIIDNELRHFASKGVTEYSIPEYVTSICHDAFYESFRLKKVTIPASVQSIGDYAFYYCEVLESVYCRPTTPPTLGVNVFDNFDGGDRPIGCRIYVPKESVDAYKAAENWSRYKQYIVGLDF